VLSMSLPEGSPSTYCYGMVIVVAGIKDGYVIKPVQSVDLPSSQLRWHHVLSTQTLDHRYPGS